MATNSSFYSNGVPVSEYADTSTLLAEAQEAAATATTKALEATQQADSAGNSATQAQVSLSASLEAQGEVEAALTAVTAMKTTVEAARDTTTGAASSAAESASSAATSALNAASSEANAQSHAVEAADSASAALASSISSETSRVAAVNARNAAESAKTAAETARTETEALYDAFDDRYLGAFDGDPTVDNDGGPLLAGAMYYRTLEGQRGMRVYSGTTWGNVTDPPEGSEGVISVFGRAGIVTATTGDYTASQITNVPTGGIAATTVQAAINELDTEKSPVGHTHTIANVTGLQAALDGKSAVGHGHAIGDVSGLQAALDGKSDEGHTHSISDVTNLQTTLDGKASSSHSHAISDTTGLQTALDAKLNLSGGSLTGDVNVQDNKVQRPYLQDYSEVVQALGSGSGTRTINLELGNVITATSGGATTWVIQNPPASGRAGQFELHLTNGGAHSQGWPTSFKWLGKTVPTLTASGTDVIVGRTVDGGTTWRVNVGKDFG